MRARGAGLFVAVVCCFVALFVLLLCGEWLVCLFVECPAATEPIMFLRLLRCSCPRPFFWPPASRSAEQTAEPLEESGHTTDQARTPTRDTQPPWQQEVLGSVFIDGTAGCCIPVHMLITMLLFFFASPAASLAVFCCADRGRWRKGIGSCLLPLSVFVTTIFHIDCFINLCCTRYVFCGSRMMREACRCRTAKCCSLIFVVCVFVQTKG